MYVFFLRMCEKGIAESVPNKKNLSPPGGYKKIALVWGTIIYVKLVLNVYQGTLQNVPERQKGTFGETE